MSEIVTVYGRPMSGNEPELAAKIVEHLRGTDVWKVLMLLVLLKSGKIDMDALVNLCAHHHSAGGPLSKIEELVAMYQEVSSE